MNRQETMHTSHLYDVLADHVWFREIFLNFCSVQSFITLKYFIHDVDRLSKNDSWDVTAQESASKHFSQKDISRRQYSNLGPYYA